MKDRVKKIIAVTTLFLGLILILSGGLGYLLISHEPQKTPIISEIQKEFLKDKEKTKSALIKACKSMENIMPQFLSIIIIVGLMLAFIDTNTISRLIGSESGVL